MSKSNLKNLNNINKLKVPYIIYNKSSYSNLLYKLKKSIIWNSSNFNLLNKNIINFNVESNLSFLISKSIYYRFNCRFVQKTLNYNPVTIQNMLCANEFFFSKKIILY